MTRYTPRLIVAAVLCHAVVCGSPARSAEAEKAADDVKLPRPDAAWVVEAELAAEAIKQAVIEGVSRGRKEKVHIELGSSTVKATILRATESEIVFKTPMASIPMAWARLDPKRMYRIGQTYLVESDTTIRLALARYCLVHNLPNEARDQISAACRIDPGARDEVVRELAFLEARERGELRRKAEAAARRRPKRAKREAKKPPKTAVPVGPKVSRVLKKLGKRHLMLGAMSAREWFAETKRDQRALWDLRYQYLAGGVNTPNNWKDWNSPPGAFATNFMRDTDRMGMIPVFSWYQMYQSLPGGSGGEDAVNKRNSENVGTMKQYLSDVKLFMEVAGKFGKSVIFHHEPDLWGYYVLSKAFESNDPDELRVVVKSTGLPDVAEFEDTAAGFGQALIHLRDTYAPNVLMGFHASSWGNPRQSRYVKYLERCGSWDILFNDPSDRDAGWREARGLQLDRAWKSEEVRERFVNWHSKLARLTGLPMIAWQIPMGNTIMATCNNTDNHYMDNHVQSYLGDAPRNTASLNLAQKGYIGLLFGGGTGGCTGVADGARDGITNPPPVEGNEGKQSRFPDDDGGYLRMQSGKYYTNPILLHRRD